MNIGISAAKFLDVRPKTFLVEPTEHLVNFFAQEQSGNRHRNPLELYWLAEHTTEGIGGFWISKLAAGYLEF